MRAVALDSSVVLAWLLEDEGLRRHALALRDDLEAGRLAPLGAAPLLFELRNGLVKGARQGRIAWEAIGPKIAAFERWRIPIEPAPADGRLIELCREFGLGWADAHWVELSLRLGVPVVTADRRLARQMATGPAWIEWIGDRPLDGG